jgi:hypothetical protein
MTASRIAAELKRKQDKALRPNLRSADPRLRQKSRHERGLIRMACPVGSCKICRPLSRAKRS